VAITNARLYRKIEEQAITDGLTGLYNHRYFYDRLQQEMARAQRYHAPVSLLLLDLDDFKRFNDRFGHLAGDEALREVGRVLRSQVRRDVDLAARYGGEEFVVLLPNTPLAGAAVVGRRLQRALSWARSAAAEGSADDEAIGAIDVAERIRSAVAATAFQTGVAGATEAITVCVGVAGFPEMAGDAQELVGHADAALYEAKQKGKNRVEVYEAE
jgi:two-component system cell cycle response regulator